MIKTDEFTFFVSSTFRDFQAERDLLHLKLLPALNRMAAPCGANVHMVDLRWGVNTGDFDFSQKSDRVLDICLNEIQRCKPYYIIFLGDRYGWIPEDGKIARAISGRMEEKPGSWSVTEMEIRYEMFLSSLDRKQLIVCMRDSLPEEDLGEYSDDFLSAGDSERKAMQRLKDFLENELEGQVIHYHVQWDGERRCLTGLDDFQTMLTKRLEDIMIELLRPFQGRDIYEQVQERAWRQMKTLAAGFAGRKNEYNTMYGMLEKERCRCVLEGGASAGKSALMAAFALSLREAGEDVFVMPCGHTPEVTTKEELQDHIIAYLERRQGIREHAAVREDRKSCIEGLLQRKSQNDRYILIIDGLDHLVPDTELQRLTFLGHYYMNRFDQVSSVYIFLSEREQQGSLPGGIDAWIRIKALSGEENRQLIEAYLRENHKLVDRKVEEAIQKATDGQMPFYTKLVAQRLLLMDAADLSGCGSDAEINDRMIRIVESLPKSEDELCEHMEKLVGERLNPAFCQRIFGLLNLSVGGLTERALEEVFRQAGWEWNSLAFTELIYYAPYLIAERPGRYFTLVHRRSAEKIPDEIARAFVQTMIADEDANSENLKIAAREGLHLACEQNDRALAGQLLKKIYRFKEKVNARDMLTSLSEKVSVWLLKVMEQDMVDAQTCAFIGGIFSQIAKMFVRNDMLMPTYQAINVRACFLAWQKSKNVEYVVTAEKEIREIYMSLGAHWMNDLPEALPPFYQLNIEYMDILFEHGLVSKEKRNQEKTWCLPNILIELHKKEKHTLTPLMPFMEWEPWQPYETYVRQLLDAMKEFFDDEYRCKIGAFCPRDYEKYGRVNLPLLEEKFGIRKKEDPSFVLGTGNWHDMSFAELLTECFSEEEAMMAVEYLIGRCS